MLANQIGLVRPSLALRTPYDGRFAPLGKCVNGVLAAKDVVEVLYPLMSSTALSEVTSRIAKVNGELTSLQLGIEAHQSLLDAFPEGALQDGRGGRKRWYRQQISDSEEKLRGKRVFYESLLDQQRCLQQKVVGSEGVQLLADAHEGMLLFLRCVRQTWWEKDKNGQYFVGYVPAYRFGRKKSTKAYWADVGPFVVRICFQASGSSQNWSITVSPVKEEAHCAGRPREVGKPNYHPHIWTVDQIQICWGSFERLKDEAIRDKNPFAVMSVIDRLFASCGDHEHLYIDMFRYWTCRIKGSYVCLCRRCRALQAHPRPTAETCPCFYHREARGETWTVPGNVLWALPPGEI